MQVEDTVTQEPVSPRAMEVVVEGSLKDVATTQEPATQEPISGMQEENPWDVAAPQEPATQESDSKMQADQGEDTVTQEPVSQRALNIAVEGNLGIVAITQEPATKEEDSEMQIDQGEDTVTQEPVPQQAMNTAVEENPRDVAATQELATLMENSEVLENTIPQEPVLLPLKKFIDLDSEQEEHYKREISNLTAEVSALRMEVVSWKSQVEENQKKMIALSEHKRIIRALEEQGAKEHMAHRVQIEELQNKIKELKNFQSMKKDKE